MVGQRAETNLSHNEQARDSEERTTEHAALAARELPASHPMVEVYGIGHGEDVTG